MHFLQKIVGIMCLLSVVACEQQHVEHESEAVKFRVTSPLKKDTSLVLEYVCQIRAIQHIDLRAMDRGYLENIFVDEGQRVRKGQPMFQITPTIYQAEYLKSKAEARVAEIEFLNTKSLADSNVVSQNELAMAKARYDRALSELALAQAHLDFTKINAPFDGLMDRLLVRHGSLLEEGDMLASVSDNSSVWVYFNVPEAQYLNYASSIHSDSLVKVRLRMANGEVFDQVGVVTTIEADFNNETGNIAFRATFQNPKGLLRHGETGNILMSESTKNALLIPQKATFEVLDKKFVFVVGKDNHIHSRQITVGAELPHIYVVTEGITEGDKILLEGLRKVKEDDKIEYSFISPDEALKSLELHSE
jgi:membrane fusion protein (multidrug efflux system)